MHIDSELYQRILGDELRRTRKSRGMSRRELIEQLPYELAEQTLATYEQGTRHCSVVRFVEMCCVLGVYPQDVLTKVQERLYTGGWQGLRVGLTEIVNLTQPELLPLRKWASDQLQDQDKAPQRQVTLTPPALERMAELCGIPTGDLTAVLQSLPQGSTNGGEPAIRHSE